MTRIQELEHALDVATARRVAYGEMLEVTRTAFEAAKQTHEMALTDEQTAMQELLAYMMSTKEATS